MPNALYHDLHEDTRLVKHLVGEDVKPLTFVPSTAEGRHEALLVEPFVPVYARRFVAAEVQPPRADTGWRR